MDPGSAMLFALIAAWRIVYGGAEAAGAQAAQEARAAADAIRTDLNGRRSEWARRLSDRIADGRAGGPATGMWWAWAAARTARAVRNGWRRAPRSAERAHSIRETTGPWRRIFDAGVAGARFAREQARQQREAQQQRPTRVPLGVCEQCGAVVAQASLQDATVGPAQRRMRVCATCRANEAGRNHQPDPEPTTAREPEDLVDADVVHDPERPELDAPTPGATTDPAPGPAPAPPEPPSSFPPPPPAPPLPPHWIDDVTDVPTPASPPIPAARIEEGEDAMAPRAPGQIVPRHGSAPAAAAARGNGGESYTHGQWNRAVTDIEKRLGELPAALEMMLHRLNTADAGRSQVTGVIALSDEISLFVQQVRAMLADVNRMEQPMLAAVSAAGGPDEIASIPYLREV
jgi:hypothetical protein